MSQQQIAQALKHCEEAKKKASKFLGFFGTPDYDDAADLYGKAAQIYRNQSMQKEALAAYDLQAEMFEKSSHLGLAARALENAGMYLYDSNQVVKGAPYLEKAAKMYGRDNKAQMTSSVMTRAARGLLDTEDPSLAAKAVDMLNSAISALENDDKHILTKDLYRMVVLCELRANKPLDAIKTLKKQLPALTRADNHDQAAKNCLQIVILCLHIGDGVLANRYMGELASSCQGFSGSEEFGKGTELLGAFEDRDQERLGEIGKAQLFTFLIPEISRMTKKLKVEAGLATKPKERAPTSSSSSSSSKPTATGAAEAAAGGAEGKEQQAEDDEEEDIR